MSDKIPQDIVDVKKLEHLYPIYLAIHHKGRRVVSVCSQGHAAIELVRGTMVNTSTTFKERRDFNILYFVLYSAVWYNVELPYLIEVERWHMYASVN